MKITKSQLKRIIKEEKVKLAEQPSFNREGSDELGEVVKTLGVAMEQYDVFMYSLRYSDTVPDSEIAEMENKLLTLLADLKNMHSKISRAWS